MRQAGDIVRPIKHSSPLQRMIAERMIAERQRLGMTRAELAEKAGVSESTVMHLERGRRSTKLEIVGWIFDVLGLEMVIAPKWDGGGA